MVSASVSPCEDAIAMFLAMHVGSIVLGAIRPSFNTLSVLLILDPLAFILRSVEMSVDTFSVSFVLKPVTLIDVSVGMDESAATIGLVVLPPAFIHRTVRPNLFPLTLTHFRASDPLTLESCVVFESVHLTELQIRVETERSRRIVVERAKLVVDLLNTNILVIDCGWIKLATVVEATSAAHSRIRVTCDLLILHPCEEAAHSRLDFDE